MDESAAIASQPRAARFGPFRLVPAQRLLTREGSVVQLGSRALDILIILVLGDGAVISQRELLARAWPGLTVEDSNLRFHISTLRKALGDGKDGARYVENVVGRGYCLVAPIDWTDASAAEAEPPAAISAPARRPARADALPLPGTLIGRQTALAEIAGLLEARRFVSIVATGGMGKTSTAVSLAHDMVRGGATVAFVDLTTVEDAAQIHAAIIAALGLPRQMGDLLAAIELHLSARPTLLILDNCEHLAGSVAEICEHLHGAVEALRILTTSREALRAGGEHVYFLPPLSLPDGGAEVTMDAALESAAVQLFVERAHASGHAKAMGLDDLRMIAELCTRLDGIALAIELVASRAGTLGILGIYNVMDEHLKMLWRGRRNAAARHQTLQATVDWSYRLLSQEEQRVLLRLSIFAGPFTLEAAQEVVRDPDGEALDVPDALASLVDKSLVSAAPIGSSVSFRLLETTQSFAHAGLAGSPDHDLVLRRYCAHLIARFTDDCVEARIHRMQDLADYIPQLGGIRIALAWAWKLVPGEAGLFVRLASRCAPVLAALGVLDECVSWSQRGLEHVGERFSGTLEELLLLESLAISSMFSRGNRSLVRDANERGLEIAERLGLVEHQLHLIAGQNIFETRTGDLKAVHKHGERHEKIARNAGTAAAMAMVSWMRLINEHLRGDQIAAIEAARLGFQYAPNEEEVRVDYFGYDHRVRALVGLARSLWLTGEGTRALEVAEEAIVCADLRRQPVSVCIALIYCSTVALWAEDLARAEEWIDRCLKTATRHSLAPYRAAAAGLHGQLQAEKGRTAAAVTEISRALAVFLTEDHHVLTVAMQAGLAKAYLAEGDPGAARHTIEAALTRAQASGGSCDEALLHLLFADVAKVENQDPAVVEGHLVEAMNRARGQGALPYELDAATRLALLSREHGIKFRPVVASLLENYPDKGGPRLLAARSILEQAA